MTAPALSVVNVDRQGAAPASSLTPRQAEALYLAALGMGQRQAAELMVITVQSYKNHLREAYRRLDVHTLVQAMHVMGWVRIDL